MTKKNIEQLIDWISETRQERLLHPKSGDHFRTRLAFMYGTRFYTVKVGRKWVMLRSNTHIKRLTLTTFKELARKNWIADARSDAVFKNVDRTGNFKLPNQWWLKYGLSEKPN
tara:strand:+ start:382 stop:720 length:339 start_codon:yes stop_codon:yes gene_type:complete